MSKLQMNSVRKTAVLLMVAAGLAACSSATVVRSPGAGGGSSSPRPSAAPRPSVPRPGATVTVQRGDTLYAISRRTNITAPDLAAWNGLSSPNTIYPGQTLKLYPPGASKPGSNSAPVAGTVV
ncbi:LysM peptidoglycan-binding domain-containing protein, partial [Xanthomonas cannabis]